jgi:hypothetical protein
MDRAAACSVPVRIRGRAEYVRVRDIPKSARARFLRAVQGFPVPPIREAGPCVYAVEWEDWLYGGPRFWGRLTRRHAAYRHWEARVIERGHPGYGFSRPRKGVQHDAD